MQEETHGNQLSGTVRRRSSDSTTRPTDDGLADLRRHPDPHPARPAVARRGTGGRPSHDDDVRERRRPAFPAHRPDAPVPPEVSALVVRLERQPSSILQPRHGLPRPPG